MDLKPSESGAAGSDQPSRPEILPGKTDFSDLNKKLDLIVKYLKKIDSRDNLRLWGGTFRFIIHLIPTLIFIFGAWYLYAYGDNIIENITQNIAQKSSTVTQEQVQKAIDKSGLGNILDYLKKN